MYEWIMIYSVVTYVIAIAMFFSYWFGNWQGTREAREYLEVEIKSKEAKK